ncbi:MAG: CPBP family intramembrane metalloprotease, partial [Candidatus Pacebacteria bacterium]|nr:CPBP family intramembrane metalloprotease [Candidatus Paceibacterota bacterium]
ACLGWGAYVVWRGFRNPDLRRVWGVRQDHFLPALKHSLLFAIPATLVLVMYGGARGRFPIPLTFWLVLVLYPLWGIAQQFALQALVTKNLRAVTRAPLARALCVAILFSLAHFPNAWLMVLVFPAGLVFTLIFERYPNIWAIGLVHGLLGSLAYYLVLGKDPGAELLGMF